MPSVTSMLGSAMRLEPVLGFRNKCAVGTSERVGGGREFLGGDLGLRFLLVRVNGDVEPLGFGDGDLLAFGVDPLDGPAVREADGRFGALRDDYHVVGIHGCSFGIVDLIR